MSSTQETSDDRLGIILLSAGSIVVHVFMESARQEYNLDGLWTGQSHLGTHEEADAFGAYKEANPQQTKRFEDMTLDDL